jgi:uncharacterized protein
MMLLLFVFTLAIGLLAHWHVKRAYARYSQTPTLAGCTGAEAARRILDEEGLQHVEIIEHEELLGDHYDPANRRLVLSATNYHGTSAAALGIAAHECGHAIQHKTAYAPLKIRMAAVGITGFASQIVLWVPLLGMLTGLMAMRSGFLIMAAGWGILMLFNLVTLPVEFDSSRRAKQVLARMGFVRPGQESAAVNSVLNAAGWTYVAAFISSMAYFLWHLLPLLESGPERED